MNRLRVAGAFVLFTGLFLTIPVAADSLGRIFTSEEERSRLDFIRKQKPVLQKNLTDAQEIDEVFEQQPVDADALVQDTLNLRGVVRRSDGKNSAWINDGNTYEGDLDTLYIKVSPQDIGDDRVTINMPDNETRIRLKVGEAYDPESRQVIQSSNN